MVTFPNYILYFKLTLLFINYILNPYDYHDEY